MASVAITNSIPSVLNGLLVKLRVLSKVKSGNKINISTLSFIDANSWVGAGKRGIAGEDRKGLIQFLTVIIHDSIKAINDYRNTEFCSLVINHLAEAKLGLKNLTVTYSSDPNVVAQLEVFIANIDLQLEKNRALLSGNNGGEFTTPVGSPVSSNMIPTGEEDSD
jgi:hypothetical protein